MEISLYNNGALIQYRLARINSRNYCSVCIVCICIIFTFKVFSMFFLYYHCKYSHTFVVCACLLEHSLV